MFCSIVEKSSVARSPNDRITRGVTPRSTATSALTRISRDERTSAAPARVNSSSIALVGMPRPWFLTKLSKVGPRPYILRSAGFPSGVVNLGSWCHAASIRFVDCCCRSANFPSGPAVDLSIRDISARGIPVDAAIPEILTRRKTSSCLSATLRIADSRKIDCNSWMLSPESRTNPTKGSSNCKSAFLATTRTSVRFVLSVNSDTSDGTLERLRKLL